MRYTTKTAVGSVAVTDYTSTLPLNISEVTLTDYRMTNRSTDGLKHAIPSLAQSWQHCANRMSKNTISTGFILLSLGDAIALSQLSLSLWEAVAFGVLCVTSYGIGLWTTFAE